MAKRAPQRAMLKEEIIRRVVISGPESTGKTELAQALAQRLDAVWVPEYARKYVENLDRPYSYEDVVAIARVQIAQEKEYSLRSEGKLLIFDTWLIITKVWFDLVFGKCPEWVLDHIRSSRIDLFLICDIDLPWIADPVRENGGEKRKELFRLYCDEIRSFGFDFEIVSGIGNLRSLNALKALSKHGLKL